MNKSGKTPGKRKPKDKAVESVEVDERPRMPKLSDEESEKVREAFHKVDADNNGTLDALELRKLFLVLDRSDLDPDKEVDEMRRLGSNRKDNRITDSDRVDLRATLNFFACRPRPIVTADGECCRHLFETLAGCDRGSDVTLPVQSIEQLLKDTYELDFDVSLVQGAQAITLADFQELCVPTKRSDVAV
uniref:EF-hand domain-containing protein n=1 Tax=Haptolina ericina TaxID=156174 RepID=A0A7S3C3Q0_9EUKA|mmetsp:Transcript_8351/g.18628  ORF Transcript_8351/g.18628 Transcript_8351/m.18628 type:complete len:189 (+) Transcript_8351:82-648(+)